MKVKNSAWRVNMIQSASGQEVAKERGSSLHRRLSTFELEPTLLIPIFSRSPPGLITSSFELLAVDNSISLALSGWRFDLERVTLRISEATSEPNWSAN